MEHFLALYAGRPFLGGRSAAHRVRTDVEGILARDPGARVILDFALIEGVSHSFADELLSPLAEADAGEHVLLANCSVDVLEELRSVAAMHRLPMPHICASAQSASGHTV
jgi:hypothetical protein